MVAALLPKQQGRRAIETQLSFDALFEEIIISPRKRRLKQACCGCAICRIWQSWPAGCVHSPPKTPAGGSLAPTYAHAYSGALGKDALSAAAEWLEDKLC